MCRGSYICQPDKHQFNGQPFVLRGAVGGLGINNDVQCLEYPHGGRVCCLLLVVLADSVARLDELYGCGVVRHEHVSEVFGKAAHEVRCIEAFVQHLVQQEQCAFDIALEAHIRQAEVILGIQHVQHLDSPFVGQRIAAERYELVEYTQCVTHASVGFLCHNIQCVLGGRYTFLRSHVLQVRNDIRYGYSLEVIHLAAAQDSRQHLVLLGCGEDEDRVRGRLLERLQEGVERTGTQHVHLIDDIHAVLAYLRRYTHLVDQVADILHAVVGRGIQFVDIERPLLVERCTRLALVAGVVCGGRVLAVDSLGEDACAGGLAYATRTAEQVGVCQLTLADRVAQGLRERVLPYHAFKRGGSVLSCRNDISVVFHNCKSMCCALSYYTPIGARTHLTYKGTKKK